MNIDITIIGAGPVGLVEACLLKSLNRNLNICILEGREKATRDFGLQVASDSIKRIIDVIDRALLNKDNNIDYDSLIDLKNCLKGWSRYPSVRTNQIQTELTKKANALGITLLRGESYKVTEDNLAQIFNPQLSTELLSPELQSLRSSLSQTKVIVGTDGAHSTIRKSVMGPDEKNLTDVETYAYALELKYDMATNSKKRPNGFDLKFAASAMEEVFTESIGKPNPDTNLLPVTDLIIVDEKIHESFLEKNKKGETIKGSPAKAWTLEELEERAKTNQVVKKYLKKIKAQIKRTRKLCEADKEGIKSLKVTTLPLSIYKSKEIVKIFQNKLVALVGDASSGLILRRGFNKGLIEAAFSVEAIIKYMEKADPKSGDLKEIPEELKHYQKRSQETFANEKWWIIQKARVLKIIKVPLKYIFSPIYKFFSFLVKKITSSIKSKLSFLSTYSKILFSRSRN